jgi:zinc transporter ZupT
MPQAGLLIQLLSTTGAHFHFRAETTSLSCPSAAYAVGGLWIHTFFDGVLSAAAFLVNLGWSIGHPSPTKMPEGFKVASIALASGRSTGALRDGVMAPPLAGVIGWRCWIRDQNAVSYAFRFPPVSLYVAASDLIPKSTQRREEPTVSLSFCRSGTFLFLQTD